MHVGLIILFPAPISFDLKIISTSESALSAGRAAGVQARPIGASREKTKTDHGQYSPLSLDVRDV